MEQKQSAVDTAGTPNTEVTTVVSPLQAALFSLFCALIAEFFLFTLNAHGVKESGYLGALGRIGVIFLSLSILHHFSITSFRAYKPDIKNIACLSILLAGTIVIVSIGRVIAVSLGTYLSTASIKIPAEAFWYAIPYATGALIIQAVLGRHYGMVFSVSLALILAVYSPGDPLIAGVILTSCLVACLSLSRFRTRSAYLRAGLHIATVTFAIALATVLMSNSFFTTMNLLMLISPLVGGILCAFLASGITPIVEYLGGYVTDMRLIEMATLDHALLKELSIQAPGTWNHSMVMGMMVESAADAIGVNPVLARVGAYFHDIGKIKKPVYFVENQTPGDNRHDKLSSSMSALIIRSHVKDGIELAKKHGLPKVIEDMIPQHHGTSRIEYFYDKALKEAEGEDAAPVDESLYRYPGPKPQTREAGILMLADGIEAAARTLSDPSFDRIQGMVQKLINKVFSSGELNECDLTLKDLHLIAKCFTRVLSGIYHQRIAYSEPVEKSKVTEVEEEPSAAKEVSDTEEGGTKQPPEDLKRLGL